ncbi:hypothetical protein Bca52824_082406 [Brassica carinata]|uniref:Replication protein A 70 kDa DNA-binding subunit B/D first OB fold domain-containing protein n=1 Tax=Brassica carinata TaxID=52824 RepID=A0A8X7TRW1_BRACI|nr:hypothetical protein Bca52824_082406 [Brassica carinata]
MAMVTSDRITLLNDVKPFKSTWKVEVKVLHSWTQRSNYPGGDSLQFILADKTGVKIHCTCKRLFLARVKKLQVGQWRFIENVSVTPAAGKYRPTSHAYKLTIISNSNVTNSSLKNDDEFLSLTTFPEIMNGSLDSNVLIDVIGQAIDIGDMQVVPVQGKETKKLELTLTDREDHQIACCLWGRYAEQILYTYKVGQVNKNFLCLLRFAKINVYKGQVQITNAFDTSTLEINPPGFDVQDYIRLMPNNELDLITDGREVVKPKGNKRQPDQWSIYPERTILDIIMATEIEKCIVTATVNAIDTDWAWYYFGCAKCHYKKVTDITNRDVVPVKHMWYCDTCHQSVTNVAPRMKRKHHVSFGADAHRKRAQSTSKQITESSQTKDVPLTAVFARILNDVTNKNIAESCHPRVSCIVPFNSHKFVTLGVVYSEKENNDSSHHKNMSHQIKAIYTGSYPSQLTFQRQYSPIPKMPNTKTTETARASRISTFDRQHKGISTTFTGPCQNHLPSLRQHKSIPRIPNTQTRETTRDSGMSKNAGAEHNFSKSDPLNEDLLSNMDGYDDLEFDSSSQESFDSDTSDHEQSILLEPEINNQSERVMKLAAMFKKTFSEVKKKVKPISPKEDG